ncbi:type III secretion system inner rod subunit SctI [Pandoraea sp. ISTKB]|uniref:type III secretion system inner rod subunit SctI n=1 Tax=Pandoraea sp. ISTKB TaxID=1586708 RepID=UPI000846C8BC|nr:type III secretion system inner rod subunit SctI [Pandoraea sp. ISTKB]ODP32772.1 hypothetical protein A9762_21020 [Pandoraea sp. ISTKB]
MLFDPSLSSILALQKTTPPVLAAEPGVGESLESRFMNALANTSAEFEAKRGDIVSAATNFDPTSAESAIALQMRLADYGVGVSMVATAARKTVGAVEALLR